jgi:UPF0755 protein
MISKLFELIHIPRIAGIGMLAILLAISVIAGVLLRGIGSGMAVHTITPGQSVIEVATSLKNVGVIRSSAVFIGYGVITGQAWSIKPGVYRLIRPVSVATLYQILTEGPHRQVSVVIPEGSNKYEIDEILTNAGITQAGSFVEYVDSQQWEGYLFPDTYFLFTDSTAEDVAKKLFTTFREKTASILPESPDQVKKIVTIASMLEKEVITKTDQKLVAGIIYKRLKATMPLQIDATVCYAKRMALKAYGDWKGCYPLSSLDFKIKSPYNTYLYRDVPPGPIGNPGLSAILSATSPTASEYWFYLTDPDTNRTIFSRNFEEHIANRRKYLQ